MIDALSPASLSEAGPLTGMLLLATGTAWILMKRRASARSRSRKAGPAGATTPLPGANRPVPAPVDPAMLKRAQWNAFTAIVETLLGRTASRIRHEARPASDGVDLWLYPDAEDSAPLALASCRQTTGRPVDSGPVRELHAMMVEKGLRTGYLAANGFFTPEAISFARHHGIELLDIHRIAQMAARLPMDEQQTLRRIAVGSGPVHAPPLPASDPLQQAA